MPKLTATLPNVDLSTESSLTLAMPESTLSPVRDQEFALSSAAQNKVYSMYSIHPFLRLKRSIRISVSLTTS